ncbi:MAG: M23 family peptidase [Rhodospirillales bacterium]|nr:M23 family peptidase [Rhodospirillales bacterium]
MLSRGSGIAILATAVALLALAALLGIHTGAKQTAAMMFDDFRERGLIVFSTIKPFPVGDDFEPSPGAIDDQLDGLTEPARRTLKARSGDTLARILSRAGVAEDDSKRAVHALRGIYDPRRVRSGQQFTLVFAGDDPRQGTLESLVFDADFAREVKVTRHASGFTATVAQRPVQRVLVKASGRIDQSFYQAGEKARVPAAILHEMMKAYAWDVDFQREIQPGDGFDVVYEQYRDDRGESVRNGRIAYMVLRLGGVRHTLYRHTTKDGYTDYFDSNGKTARKGLLRTPIDGARLASGYGNRMHPILGYTTMHRGVDFASPAGTPIYAAGDGIVDLAGDNGAYGLYVRLRHEAQYATAYGHLSRIATGIRKGRRVRQGDIIGYVGSTGRSTGPHLHYEVLMNGNQTNPMTVKMPPGRILAGPELKRFEGIKANLHQQVADLADTFALARAD